MTYHVISTLDGRWAVRRSGSERATRTFNKQGAAVKFARQLVQRSKQGVEVFIHYRDGRVRSKMNLGVA